MALLMYWRRHRGLAVAFPFRDAELAVPLSIETDPRRADRGAGFLRVIARLRAGVPLSAAKANLDAIAARLRRDHPDANAKKTGVNLRWTARSSATRARC